MIRERCSFRSCFQIMAEKNHTGYLRRAAGFAVMVCLAGTMLFSMPSGGTDTALEKFVASLSSMSADFSYEYAMDDGRTVVTGSGTVTMQGDAYAVDGNGLEIFCDGNSIWTVDRAAREVVIEACSPESASFVMNPAALLGNFDKVFSVKSSAVTSSGDVSYTLMPAADTGMTEMEIVLASDGSRLTGAAFKTKDGAVVRFTIPSFSFSALSSPERFVPDISSLDSDYIITDLR